VKKGEGVFLLLCLEKANIFPILCQGQIREKLSEAKHRLDDKNRHQNIDEKNIGQKSCNP
jgi:hypothetical protein